MKVVQDFQRNFYQAMDARIQANKLEHPPIDARTVNLSTKQCDRVLVEYPVELRGLWSKDHEELFGATNRRPVSFDGLVHRAGGYVAKFRHAGFVWRISVFVGLLLRA
jgi:hypothetical protein